MKAFILILAAGCIAASMFSPAAKPARVQSPPVAFDGARAARLNLVREAFLAGSLSMEEAIYAIDPDVGLAGANVVKTWLELESEK